MPPIFTRKFPPSTHPLSLRARLVRWANGPTLVRDLSIVLIVKLTLLMALKYAFFNHPQAEHMSLPPAVVAAQLLGSAPTPYNGGHHDE